MRHEFRRHLGCSAERGVIEDREIFIDGAARCIWRQTRGALDTGAVTGIGLDQTGINGEAFTADQALIDAPLQDRLEQAPQQIAVAEAAVPVLGEGRMITSRTWRIAILSAGIVPSGGKSQRSGP